MKKEPFKRISENLSSRNYWLQIDFVLIPGYGRERAVLSHKRDS